MKYLNRKWVLVSLAVIATVVVGWYLLHKTNAGKKVAAKAAGNMPAPATTVPAPATTVPATAQPAAALAGNVRLQ